MMRLANGLMEIYYLLIEPIQIAFKKKQRLLACKCYSLRDLMVCTLTRAHPRDSCIVACPGLIDVQEKSILKFLTAQRRMKPWTARFYCMPAVVDLAKFPDVEAYERFVKKKSGGNTIREVQRASASYSCRIINRHAHTSDIEAVANSMLVRTGGPVVSAILARFFPSAKPVPVESDQLVRPPECPFHYRMDWGVFVRSDGANLSTEGDKLVGYVYLRRVENCLRIMAFMGHGEYLEAGVMKLLFSELMTWVLSRKDEAVIGLEYVQYGAIEQGQLGLLEWKRRFGFEPAVFA